MGCGKCTVCRRDFLWLLHSSREGPTTSHLWATWKRQPAFWAFVRGRCRRLQSRVTELSLPVFNLSPQPHSCCVWFLKSTSPRSSFYRKSMAPPVPWIEGWWRKGLGSLPSTWTLCPALGFSTCPSPSRQCPASVPPFTW